MYLINEVSRQVNLSQKRIREYERDGFINPDRAPNTNNRIYTDFDILQIKRINYLLHKRGFTLACLRQLLVLAPCWNIFGCKNKEACSAYKQPHENCWTVRANGETQCPGPCLKCAIYINREEISDRILEKEYN